MKRGGISSPPPKAYDNARREQQAAENRQRILAAGAELLRSGTEALTVPSIARAAGLSVPTVYRNFSTREALLGAVHEHIVRKLGAPLAPYDDLDTYLAAMPTLYDYFHRNRDFIRVSLEARRTEEVAREGQRSRDRAIRRVLDPLTGHLSAEDQRAVVALVRVMSGAEVALSMFDRFGLPPAACARLVTWAISRLRSDLEAGGGPGAPEARGTPRGGAARPGQAEAAAPPEEAAVRPPKGAPRGKKKTSPAASSPTSGPPATSTSR